jgi:DNA-binding transcriptional MerR regulator/methylmalonyl-CoA mutase cobalamin-binding subunit
MVAPDASWMPIRELSRRVGVSTDLLRKWEQRYAVLNPQRTAGNQRLYSRVDEARARVMLRHLHDGMPAAQAAELAISTRFRIAPDATTTARVAQVAQTTAAMQAALERYDETTADQALETLHRISPANIVIGEVLLPYLHDIGERWQHGQLSIAQEHFATAFIHSRLLGLARGWDRGLGPRALLACPPQEQHTLGLIAFGIALHHIGWRITYLAADTPIPMIAEAATSIHPRLIVISAATPDHLTPALPQLRELRPHNTVAIAGAGANQDHAHQSGAIYLPDDPITSANTIFAQASGMQNQT